MVRVYIDSSELVNRAHAIRSGIAWQPPLEKLEDDAYTLASSAIATVEVHRALLRTEEPHIAKLLTTQTFIDIDSFVPALIILETAAALPVRFLKALDAIHVATALVMNADVVMTSDRQMQRACAELGIDVA